MAAPMSYIVAGSRRSVQDAFEGMSPATDADWRFVDDPEALALEVQRGSPPRYIFFVHWSWRVDPALIREIECVGFHMTALPFGRGGSPLQNLISRGATTTTLTAFRLTDQIDAGPIYLQEKLGLHGAAEEIYSRAYGLAMAMIRRIVAEEPDPIPQRGEVVRFRRRDAHESELPALESLTDVYDFVRMLDAEGYPRAFLQ